jgi:thiol-disulfide isomerase/thioredoxin
MKTIYLIFVLLFFHSAYGQVENRYPVVFTDLTKPAWFKLTAPAPFVILHHTDCLKNIPALADTVRIYKYSLFQSVQKYQDYLSGNLSREAFETYVTNSKIDTSTYARYKGIKNGFHVYVGVSYALQKKYVIVDENNNNDFSDDTLYSFDLKDYEAANFISIKNKTIIHATPLLELYTKNQIIPKTARIELHPLGTTTRPKVYKTEIDRYLDVDVSATSPLEGTTIIHGVRVNLLAYIGLLTPLSIGTYSQDYLFLLREEGDPEKRRIEARLRDTIKVANRMLHLSEAKGDTLYIDDLGSCPDSSRLGNYLPALYSMQLDGDGSMVRLNDMLKGKYVLIDFWGSWCVPCIASFPKIQEFYEMVYHRKDVAVIGIALDYARDLEKVKKLIADKGLKWPNYWNEYKDIKRHAFPHAKLHMNQFPTYMIVDKTGKIVYQSNNSTEAIDFFHKMIERK